MAKGQRFQRKHLIRLSRLLDMMYKPSELAEEIGVTVDTVHRSYLPGGAPFERDEKGQVWIHGSSFAAWAQTAARSNRDQWKLEDGQAWCFNCRGVVTMLKPKLRHEGRYTKIYQGKCATCGKAVNRAYAAADVPEGVTA